MKVRWQSGATYSSHNNASRPPWPPASRGSQSTRTHTLGRNLNGNLVPCLPTPRTKDKRRRATCTAAASKARLVFWPACTILFLLLHFGGRTDRQTGERASTAYVPGEQQSTPFPSSPCASFLSWSPWFCYCCLRLAGTSMSPSSRARHFRPPPFVFLFFPRIKCV